MRARFCGRVSRTHVSQEERSRERAPSRPDKKRPRLLLSRSLESERAYHPTVISSRRCFVRRDRMHEENDPQASRSDAYFE